MIAWLSEYLERRRIAKILRRRASARARLRVLIDRRMADTYMPKRDSDCNGSTGAVCFTCHRRSRHD